MKLRKGMTIRAIRDFGDECAETADGLTAALISKGTEFYVVGTRAAGARRRGSNKFRPPLVLVLDQKTAQRVKWWELPELAWRFDRAVIEANFEAVASLKS